MSFFELTVLPLGRFYLIDALVIYLPLSRVDGLMCLKRQTHTGTRNANDDALDSGYSVACPCSRDKRQETWTRDHGTQLRNSFLYFFSLLCIWVYKYTHVVYVRVQGPALELSAQERLRCDGCGGVAALLLPAGVDVDGQAVADGYSPDKNHGTPKLWDSFSPYFLTTIPFLHPLRKPLLEVISFHTQNDEVL